MFLMCVWICRGGGMHLVCGFLSVGGGVGVFYSKKMGMEKLKQIFESSFSKEILL